MFWLPDTLGLLCLASYFEFLGAHMDTWTGASNGCVNFTAPERDKNLLVSESDPLDLLNISRKFSRDRLCSRRLAYTGIASSSVAPTSSTLNPVSNSMGSSRTIPAMTSLTGPTLFNFHSTGRDDINGSRGMISMSNSSRSDGLTVAATIDMITAKTMLLQFYNYHDQYSLDSAINSLERLVALTSDTHRQKHRWCWTLASIYGHRYVAKADPADIRKSILFYQMSVDIAPDFYDGRADHLYDIGLAYMTRYSASCSDYTDVQNAEIFFKRAIGWFFGSEPPKIWEDLAIALFLRYEHSGSLECLDQAIAVCRLAVKKCTEDVLQRRSASAMLAFTLSLRFRHEAHPEDAEELDTFVYEAAEGQKSEFLRVTSIALMLRERFRHSGRPAEIDEAVSTMTKLLDSTNEPELQSRRLVVLHNLGEVLRERFDRFRDPKDQEYSLFAFKEVAKGAAKGISFHRKGSLADLSSSLGLSYSGRFEHTHDPDDLDAAIATTGQAIADTPLGHWSIHSRLGDLGSLLQTRFTFFGKTDDLDEAHKCYQQALCHIPDDHRDKSKLLRYLGRSYMDRFTISGQNEDLNKAVEALLSAVEATPKSYPGRVLRLMELGEALLRLSEISQADSDLDRAISTFKEGALLNKGSFSCRMTASWLWGETASLRCRSEVLDGRPIDVDDAGQNISPLPCAEDNSCYQGFSRMMDLVPLGVWLGDTIAFRHDTLKVIGKRIRRAADLICIQYGRSTTAVEWLEQGRSVVWRQQLNLRTRFDELQDVEPTLAAQMRDVSMSLDSASTHHGADARPEEPCLDESGPPRRRLAGEWEKLLLEARQVPGFERLLQPRQISELQKAAHVGPIVMLNMGAACHALLVLEDRADVLHVPLRPVAEVEQLCTDLNELLANSKVRSRLGLMKKNRNEQGSQEAQRILRCLWINIVKPILDALNFPVLGRSEPHPRIVWCPTGSLAFLPIHAAGDYSREESGHRISDYVISSYTTTISALLDGSCRPASSEIRCLTVSQSNTPDLECLPYTDTEVEKVKGRVRLPRVEELRGEKATVAAVHDAMERCNWIHLACHAIQNSTDPLKSAFCLADGRLQLQDIIRKTHPHADFAFLSACQTSTGDHNLADEAVHLAAGVQLAGYRSIIATMWSIGDEDGPLVADEVYAHLLRDGKPDSSRAAHALHHAVLKLQETTKPDDRDDSWFLRWVPFIHIGA